jgi:hypothetical protein
MLPPVRSSIYTTNNQGTQSTILNSQFSALTSPIRSIALRQTPALQVVLQIVYRQPRRKSHPLSIQFIPRLAIETHTTLFFLHHPGHELTVLLQGAGFTGNSLLEPRPLFVRQFLDVRQILNAFLLALLDPAADPERVAFDTSPSNVEDQVDDSNLAGAFEDRCFGEFGRRGDVDLEGLEVQIAEVAVDVCGRALDGLCVEAEEMEVAAVAETQSQIPDVLCQKPGVESSLHDRVAFDQECLCVVVYALRYVVGSPVYTH